ncbi:RNA polymerase sigma factor [Pseudomonas stutzeri]|uniref:RNA polymerase sigma factor n=1 Tax=Stutzerimonas stutzeri group TaxID=136846 RepID=UPI0007B9028B|nr:MULTISPECIES: RNA polymerase sigma factor [Stutzerimonas stutzeri group]KZX63044.1 peptidylprolyl isomerase [Stutzerimonas frequens]MCC8343570.1 RNA polymerase sigma factor [Stutzerimonas stutzeri]
MRDNNKIPDACLQCYVHHRQQLVAHLTRLGGCRALAEDLAQDAWLKLAQVMPEQSLANPKAYLFRIATNLLRDALRHRALVGAGDEAPLELIEAVQADPCGLVEHQCALRCVLRQLDDLPPRCRQVFELARLEGLSQAEIAERLGISVNTVIAQLAKARQRLERP